MIGEELTSKGAHSKLLMFTWDSLHTNLFSLSMQKALRLKWYAYQMFSCSFELKAKPLLFPDLLNDATANWGEEPYKGRDGASNGSGGLVVCPWDFWGALQTAPNVKKQTNTCKCPL